MKTVFYPRFDRHAHGEGLKAHSTHYCPGCGHGIVHKYIAEVVEELGIQDRTINISPVGCAVFLYYYLDVGNTQAAHGRAPAVAVGHKMANPNSIVISYQGDGDLASIGLAEIMHLGEMGIPITVIFINNANYAMTGGQMAPTTLPGQKTTTTPYGRNRLYGTPLRMAEIMAQMDGPIYVERVALFDNKQRVRAKRAIKKAIQLQVENKGMAFVEVLSECPTQWHMSPQESEKWVKEEMTKYYPLGVKKDISNEVDGWFQLESPVFDSQKVIQEIGATEKTAPRFGEGFPSHLAERDIAIKFAGAGGDGAQTAAMLVTRSAIHEGWDATHIPSYGPESRGGTSYADVHIAEVEVLSPAAPNPNILVAFNAPSLKKFAPRVQPNGIIVYDSSVISEIPDLDPSIKLYGIPFAEIAAKNLGKLMVKNIVALGAFQAATQMFPEETFLYAIEEMLTEKGKQDYLEINRKAFKAGIEAFNKAAVPGL